MHYNFETKAALGPYLGFGETREGFLFTSTLFTRQREEPTVDPKCRGKGSVGFPWQEGS